jgi:DNA ligase (NAD+)
LSRVLFGLGIRHVGTEAAQLLARRFRNLEKLADASLEEIETVHGIGPVIAQSVREFFRDPHATKVIERLREHGVRTDEPQKTVASNAFRGLTVVITGTLPGLSRSEAKERIQAAGGKVTDSVSKATSVLVAGAEAGSKLEKAKAIGIEIIDEAELLRRLGR